MSFFSEEDRATRQHKLNPPGPSRDEVIANSLQRALEELPGALKQIRESYREGAQGVSFSFDSSPFPGMPKRDTRPEVDNEVMVAELARLVTAKIGIVCTVDPGNGPTKSGFGVNFTNNTL
jgi:hypothetical protein